MRCGRSSFAHKTILCFDINTIFRGPIIKSIIEQSDEQFAKYTKKCNTTVVHWIHMWPLIMQGEE